MDVFPLLDNPDWGLTTDVEDSAIVVKLGDGYELRKPSGINPVRDVFKLNFSFLDPAVALSTYEWLKVRQNLTAFLWTNPDSGEQIKVVCQGVSKVQETWGNSTMSATFRQDFNPG
jgi:phage-related protein